MKALMITLGHNASALFYDGKNKPIGYEEERFNLIKNSSEFPKQSISMIINQVGNKLKNSKVYISHWFDTFEVNEFNEKYFDHEYFNSLVAKYNMEVITLDEDFTHHDAHAYSSKAFFEDSVTEEQSKQYGHYIVADGFGNKQEVISIYRDDFKRKPQLIHRIFGFKSSLGLMFQFACAFTGMKENQDEGKFSGYEVLIDEVVNKHTRDKIDNYACVYTFAYRYDNFSQYMGFSTRNKNKDVNIVNNTINTAELDDARKYYYGIFNRVLDEADCKDADEREKRVIIGYFIQTVLEKIMKSIIQIFNMRNVYLSGGVFYNVKLNSLIEKNIPGNISIMPLSGDQGAAIGLYRKYSGEFEFHDLCYGNRDIHEIRDFQGVYYIDNDEDFVHFAVYALKANKIVNIFQGNMEFGARTLGNTSTLALPTRENVEYINQINGRNTVMPMAPIMLRSAADSYVNNTEDIDRTVKSERFMGTIYDLHKKHWNNKEIDGVTHNYPGLENPVKNFRPQIIDDDSESLISEILHNFADKCLINTSFNVHGCVIPYSVYNAQEQFIHQSLRDIDDRIILIIRTNK